MAAAAAGGATAATLSESDMAGGAFGASWDRLTEVGAGVTTIAGTGSQNSFDNFVLTGLSGGAQDISLRFAAPGDIGHSYSAGGTILYSTQAFKYGWDGNRLGSVQVDYSKPEQSLILSLGDDFAGLLYLALNFTHGSDLAYTIGLPAGASVAPIPLPAGLVLLGSAIGALGLAQMRRRKAA